ncbi:GPW/gp25 family protein [Pseudothauera nasutitermitis]|uniref:GPW/gp25 family protein n=1 Tax=Pseudothauera nasutitermitis TaxID=2565930 RepID=UPI001454D416|nr:GPW/gp25 family protein [Pseudothauera nasutitermitis]
MFLFERLSVRPPGPDGRPEPFDEEAAILAQVQRILATARHAGDTAAVVPWGVCSPVDIGQAASVRLEALAQELAGAIARHEPRLRQVRVTVEAQAQRGASPDNPFCLVVNACFPGDGPARSVRLAAPR